MGDEVPDSHSHGECKRCSALRMAELKLLAELARLQAQCDALAAENRLLVKGLDAGALDENGNCCLCGDSGDNPALHASHCPVGAAHSTPHTTREVERVKALEAVAGRAWDAYARHRGHANAGVYQMALLGAEMTSLANALAALDKVSKEVTKCLP